MPHAGTRAGPEIHHRIYQRATTQGQPGPNCPFCSSRGQSQMKETNRNGKGCSQQGFKPSRGFVGLQGEAQPGPRALSDHVKQGVTGENRPVWSSFSSGPVSLLVQSYCDAPLPLTATEAPLCSHLLRKVRLLDRPVSSQSPF